MVFTINRQAIGSQKLKPSKTKNEMMDVDTYFNKSKNCKHFCKL